MIRSVIVDDEQHCTNRLTDLLNRYFKQTVHVAGTFATVDEAETGIIELKPDLVFLDVQLNGLTGFDLINRMPEINFEVIFTTAYDSYAIKAFKFSALDYLLKPIDSEDLLQAIDKFKKSQYQNDLSEKFSTFFHNLKNQPGTSKKITVHTSKGLEFLPISDIVRCEADVNYTTIYLKDKHQLMVAKTLKDFNDMLADHQFFRIHNSHLINLDYIKSYQKGKGGYVILVDNTSLEVSTRRKDLFLKKMEEM
ncbi:MAG TPA: LytTR family DNA-binding domain-containing protein [Mucilaginibacter sp.]|jgi:two-component system LytT family response regulator